MEVTNDSYCSWINDHSLNSPLLVSGYIAITKKTIKNTIPKLLLEPIFTLSI